MSDNTAPALDAAASSGRTGEDNSGIEGAGETTPTGPCNVCNTPCKKRCSRCSSAFYCSQEHQKLVWKEHKFQCSPLVRAEDETFGRFWVASRDIKVGEIILQEKPIILVPLTTKDEVVCVGCAKSLKESISRNSCSKCGWPVCGSECEKASAHAENECPVFASRAIRFPPPGISINSANLGLGILRVLLTKTKDPELWNRIIDLQHEISEVDPELQAFSMERFEVSQNLAAAREALNVAPELAANDEEWGQIYRILKLNAFEVGCELHPHQSGLFLRGSFLTHSCVPNAEVELKSRNHISVRATTDIKKGQMVTTRRILTDKVFLEGTDHRLMKTRQAGFWCKCLRCLDPTELGTYASAIMCARCPEGQGIMLPSTFHDLNEPYRCQTPGCQHTMPRTKGHTNYSLMKHVFREIEADTSIQGADVFATIISRTSGKILHPNHWLMIQISVEWLSYHKTAEGPQRECGVKMKELEQLLVYCRRVADYMNKIERGLTKQRANHLYMSAEILRYNLEGRKDKMKLSKEQELAEWTQVHEWALVALNYFKMDDANLPEAKKYWGTCISRLEPLQEWAKWNVEQLRGDCSGDGGAQTQQTSGVPSLQ